MKLARLSIFLALPLMFGCTSFERDTFNTLAASQAVINQAQTDYTSGAIKETTCSFTLINDAKAAQTVAVQAMVVYEHEKTAGTSLTAQTAVVVADIAALPGLLANVKGLYASPAACNI